MMGLFALPAPLSSPSFLVVNACIAGTALLDQANSGLLEAPKPGDQMAESRRSYG